MHPMLTIAVRAARRAGSIINRASLNGGALNVRSKRVNDFVTRVDQAAEEAIIEIVRKAHPDHGFLAEESGRAAGAAEYVWIIDPLDGTTNFIHGFRPGVCRLRATGCVLGDGALAVGHGGRSTPDPGSGRAGGRFQRRSALHAIRRHQRSDAEGLSPAARSAALRVAVASELFKNSSCRSPCREYSGVA